MTTQLHVVPFFRNKQVVGTAAYRKSAQQPNGVLIPRVHRNGKPSLKVPQVQKKRVHKNVLHQKKVQKVLNVIINKRAHKNVNPKGSQHPKPSLQKKHSQNINKNQNKRKKVHSPPYKSARGKSDLLLTSICYNYKTT